MRDKRPMDDMDFRNHIEQIKAAVRMDDAARVMGLRAQGKRFFCPGCQKNGGKTPDLEIYDHAFKCFKCGEGGDVIDLFVLAGRSKADAIADLERIAGIERPHGSRMNSIQKTLKKRMDDIPKADECRSNTTKNSGDDTLSAAERSALYAAFLNVCCPIHSTPGAEYLEGRGIDADIAASCGIRYCPDPAGLWNLADKETIKASGLSAFYAYQKAALPFLVFPYIREGSPVYLKARILLSKEEANQKGIQRFMNTGGRVPCLWNHDAIAGADRVLICEGEMDALTAVQMEKIAVGLPGWSHFKDEWVDDFKGKDVILFLDADDKGDKGVLDIAKRFIRAGLPPPRQITLNEGEGKDLNEFYLIKTRDQKIP